MTELASTASRFDRWASSYEDNTLQQYLFVPVHQTTLQLAVQLLPHARRILDVGCGTGRLLRQARPCYPTAELVGVDLAGRMVATASAATPTRLAVGYVHGRVECLPFTNEVFDLDLHHPVAPALDGPGGRDRRDRPRPHPGWGGGPRRRLSQLPPRSEPSPAASPPRRRAGRARHRRSPPTTWTSSAVTRPPGSGCPTSRSSRHASNVSRAPDCRRSVQPACFDPGRRVSGACPRENAAYTGREPALHAWSLSPSRAEVRG